MKINAFFQHTETAFDKFFFRSSFICEYNTARNL